MIKSMILSFIFVFSASAAVTEPVVQEIIHKRYPNGNPLADLGYKNGIQEGESKVYREDGSLELTGIFENGKLKEHQFFDTAGNPTSTMDWSRAEYLFRQALDEVRWEEDSIAGNELAATHMLGMLSGACETYATVHKGVYPESVNALFEEQAPFLPVDICERSDKGYRFTCSVSVAGYEFIATPLQKGITGGQTFKVTNGGVITHLE